MLTAAAIVSPANALAPQVPDRSTDRGPGLARLESPHVMNLESFAEDVVRGRANVTIVGDSINNDGQGGFMFCGYLLEWQPLRWRQVHPPINTNGAIVGSWLELSGTAQYDYLRPGQTTESTTRFAGTYPRSIRVISGEGWTGRAISSGFHVGSFSIEGGQVRQAVAPHVFLRSSGPYRHRFLVINDNGPDSRNTWTLRSRNSAAGTGWTDSLVNVEFEAGDRPALHWVDHVIDGSPEGMGHQGTGLFSVGGPLGANEQLGLAGVILTDLGTETGLGLTYVGDGGWRSENHAYPIGDPELPAIASSAGPYIGGYSDEALRLHMEAHETSHILIWIGQNNAGVDGNNPQRTVDDVLRIIERYRRVHDQNRTNGVSAEPLKFLVVSPYATTSRSFFPNFAARLRSSLPKDVAFIDLCAMMTDRYGSPEDWAPDLLADGIHPNLNGARRIAAMLWQTLVDAIGPTADLDRDGKVGGADFGLFLLSSGVTGYP